MNGLFDENIIAILWDFDCTMIPGYMQKPLFEHYRINEGQFWKRIEDQVEKRRQDGIPAMSEMLYLNQILDCVKSGQCEGLNNELLRKLGGEIEFYEGLPGFLAELKEAVDLPIRRAANIKVEHYVLSSGLRQMIEGSAIASHLDGIWACEFAESEGEPRLLERVLYVIDHTTKTRAVFEINKGVNVRSDIEVNITMPEEKRRVPIRNMIYVGDGPSDVPVFSVVNEYKGHTLAVYNPDSQEAHDQAYQLSEEKRVNHYAEAVFHADSPAGRWLVRTVRGLAQDIHARCQRNVKEQVGKPLKHTHDH